MGNPNDVDLPTQGEIDYRNRLYTGKRIELISMPDPQPIEAGTIGTCNGIDGIGQLIMKWDNGRTLSLIPNVDDFKVV